MRERGGDSVIEIVPSRGRLSTRGAAYCKAALDFANSSKMQNMLFPIGTPDLEVFKAGAIRISILAVLLSLNPTLSRVKALREVLEEELDQLWLCLSWPF